MTYSYYLKQTKTMLEWKLFEKLARNPGLMSEIDRTFYHPLTHAYAPIQGETFSTKTKIKILYRSSQIISFKKLDSDNNYEVIYCHQDDEYRVYCDNCDNLCIERFYKNLLISQTHANNVCQRTIE